MITYGLTIVIISILFYIIFEFILFSFIMVKTYNINIIIYSFPERGFIMSVSYVGELFGRESILDSLSNRLEIALKGKGCIDLLHGDAGIGKSAIINKFATLHPEVQTLYVQCSALTDADDLYKPCSDLLNSIESIKWQEQSKVKKFFGSFNMEKVFDVGGKILGFIPGLELPSAIIDLAISAYAGDTNPEVLAETYKNDKVKLYSDIILGLSMEKPLVVVFDDLHWADRGTINVFKHIFQIMLEARQGLNDKNFNLLLIGSLRGSEAKADSLHNGINEMFSFMDRYNFGRTQKLMIQHEVQELDAASVQALITYNFDNDEKLSDGLKRWLCESSNGNPLLLSNLIDVLRENSAVESTSTGWVDFNEVSYISDGPVLKGRMLRLEKQGAFRSKSVVALEALRNLTDTELKILYVASVFKDYFTIESLAHVCKIIESDLYWPINRLIKMGFIIEQGEVDNGLEVQNRYQIKSKALIEALRNDMSVHQITYYENSLGEYYSSKIKAIDYMEETVDSLDLSDLVAKPVISDKYSKINKVRDFYHKMASYHYMKGKNSLKAIEHGLFGIERLVERYKETKEQTPSPLELDGLYKTIESQISLYDTLFDKVIDELILVKHSNNELIQQLKIRALKSYAEFYACFGQYTKSREYLNIAFMLSKFTKSEIDDAELMIAIVEINLSCGNHTQAIKVAGSLIDYLESLGSSWTPKERDDIIEKVLEVINQNSILQAKYINKLLQIAEQQNSDYIKEISFAQLRFYFEHNNIDKAKTLLEAIKVKYSDIIWGYYLDDIIDVIYDIDNFILSDQVADLFCYGCDTQYDYKHKLEYNWSINACSLLLPILLNEIKNIDSADASLTVWNILRLEMWLKQLIDLDENKDISEYIDDEDSALIFRKRIIEVKTFAIKVLKDNEKNFDINKIYTWLRESISTGIYIDDRDDILFHILKIWPECVPADDVRWLFNLMMGSDMSSNDTQDYYKNINVWSVFYDQKPSDDLAKLIVNSIESQIENWGNILTTANLISDILLYEDDFKRLVDNDFYANLAIEIYINHGEYDQARDIAKYLEAIKQDIINNINNLEVDDISGSKIVQDSKLFIYDGEDAFSRYITSQKLLNRADYVCCNPDDFDTLEELRLYVKAYKLMQYNEYAETKIDDVCDDIALELDCIDHIDMESLNEIFGSEYMQESVEATKLSLQLRYRYEALEINKSVGDIKRIVECLVNIIQHIEAAIDDEDLAFSISNINGYLSFTGFTVDTLLKELTTVLIDNSLFDKALNIYFEFDSLSGLDFADSYMIPAIAEAIKEIIKNIDDTILRDYLDSLLTVKNPF